MYQKRDIFPFCMQLQDEAGWRSGSSGSIVALSKGHDAMNQYRSRSTARAIAIAKPDESETRKTMLIRAAVVALGALTALAALPFFWSF